MVWPCPSFGKRPLMQIDYYGRIPERLPGLQSPGPATAPLAHAANFPKLTSRRSADLGSAVVSCEACQPQGARAGVDRVGGRPGLSGKARSRGEMLIARVNNSVTLAG
jgi:hypothetical protein